MTALFGHKSTVDYFRMVYHTRTYEPESVHITRIFATKWFDNLNYPIETVKAIAVFKSCFSLALQLSFL
jgi:hypothetical protein